MTATHMLVSYSKEMTRLDGRVIQSFFFESKLNSINHLELDTDLQKTEVISKENYEETKKRLENLGFTRREIREVSLL